MDKTTKNQLTRFLLIFSFSLIFTAPVGASKTAFNTPVLNQPAQEHKIVVLLHGLMRSHGSMNALRFYLERQGYEVYSYSYPSHKYTIEQHGTQLSQFVKDLEIKNPDAKIYFITHSLGGIITREALAQCSSAQLKHIGGLIMLAPPNQGSFLAKYSTKLFPLVNYAVKPLAELSSEQSSYVHQVPVPPIKMGIIAGRFDAKVPPAAAYLEGQPKPMIVNANHTFIMNNTQTRQLIISFLEKGSF